MGDNEVISSWAAYRGRVISVRVDQVRLPNGRETAREIIDHAGAVTIAAINHAGDIALVKQYRHAVKRELLELPAGTLEPNERPEVTAARELREETGLVAGSWVRLGSFFSSPGFLHEELHAFLAREVVMEGQQQEDDEDIEVVWFPLAALLADPGKLVDAKTLATLLLVEAYLGAEGCDSAGRECA